MNDNETTINELRQVVQAFVKARKWDKHQTPRNLATSIAIEAAELLEKFQWGEYRDEDAQNEIEAEVADIMIYLLEFVSISEIDLSKAVVAKLEKNGKKYPVEAFASEESAANYWKIKKEHRSSK